MAVRMAVFRRRLSPVLLGSLEISRDEDTPMVDKPLSVKAMKMFVVLLGSSQ